MTRFWVSWWSGNYAEEGCSAPPFQFWESGFRARPEGKDGDDCSLCAVIDADSEEQITAVIAKHFPDYEMRFCEPRAADYAPGDRFPGFENKTKLQ